MWTSKDVEAFVSSLTQTDKPALITVHRDPDPDAVGSALALHYLLEDMGIAHELYAKDTFRPPLTCLPGYELFKPVLEGPYDPVIYVDCSNQERVRESALLLPFHSDVTVVNIDHHADNTMFGDINIFNVTSSVGELLYDVFCHQGWEITPRIATALYYAMCFDTGRFLYSNTRESTLKAASHLLSRGADLELVHFHLFENLDKEAFALMKVALDNLEVHPEKGYAFTVVPKSAPDTSFKVIDFIRQLGDVDVFVVFNELHSEVKVNLRSKGDVNIRLFANSMGGGGHDKASGILMKGSLSAVKKKVLAGLDAYLESYGA